MSSGEGSSISIELSGPGNSTRRIRELAISMYAGSRSIPIKRKPSRCAALPVLRTGSGKCQKMPARFQDAQAFGPYFDARHIVVPLFPHETQTIRRVGNDGVDGIVRHRPHDFKAITVVKFKTIPILEIQHINPQNS